MSRPTNALQVIGAVLLTFALAASAHAITLVPGDIIIADPGSTAGVASNDGQILVVPQLGGTASVIIATGSGLDDPVSVALEADGNIIVADQATTEIYRVDPNTETFTTVVAVGALTTPQAVMIDPVTGDLIVLDSGFPAVVRFSSAGAFLGAISAGQNFAEPTAMAFEADGNIVVTDTQTTNPGSVIRVDVTAIDPAANQTVLSNLLIDPDGIAVDAATNFIIAEPGLNAIVSLSNDGTTSDVVSTIGPPNVGYGTPAGVAVGGGGTVVIADPFGANGTVSRVDPAGSGDSNQTVLTALAPMDTPEGITVATVPEPTLVLAQGTALMVLGLIASRRRRS